LQQVQDRALHRETSERADTRSSQTISFGLDREARAATADALALAAREPCGEPL
jgi:hypothetical protein